MGKIKMFTFVSIDGYMTRADGDIDWLLEFRNLDETDYGFKNFFNSINTVIMNQNHYRMLLGYDLFSPCLSKFMFMVSTELDYKISCDRNVEYILSGTRDFSAALEFFNKYKPAIHGDMWLAGDDKLIHELLENSLVDEITVTMLPVSLGAGTRLFPVGFKESKWLKSELIDFQNGVVQMTYRAIGPS